METMDPQSLKTASVYMNLAQAYQDNKQFDLAIKYYLLSLTTNILCSKPEEEDELESHGIIAWLLKHHNLNKDFCQKLMSECFDHNIYPLDSMNLLSFARSETMSGNHEMQEFISQFVQVLGEYIEIT